jgi:hypothetical protein
MSVYRLCYFSATAMELPSLSEGVRQYEDTIGGIKVHARTRSQLFDPARKTAFVDQAMASDAIIATLHGGKASFPAFDDLAQRLGDVPADQRPYLHIQPTSGDEDSVEAARKLSVDFGTPAWDEIQRYLNQGGHANFHQMLIYLHNHLFHTRMPCLPPTALPHEGIEVLKGPASSLYGGEAMGGVVNVILKKNTDELTGMAELGYGSFDTNFHKGMIGGAIGKGFDFDLSARRYDQADDLTMGNGEERPNTSYMTQNGLLRLGADLGEPWRVDLTGDIYQGRDIETPGDIFVGSTKPGQKDIDRYGVDLIVEGQLGPSKLLSLTGYQTSEVSEIYKRYAGYSDPAPTAPYRSYDSDTQWQGVQLKDTLSLGDHRLIAGIDYQQIDKESRSYNRDGTRKAPYSPDEGRENWAGYKDSRWM